MGRKKENRGRKPENRDKLVAYVKKSTRRSIRKMRDKKDPDYNTIGRVVDEVFESHQREMKRSVN